LFQLFKKWVSWVESVEARSALGLTYQDAAIFQFVQLVLNGGNIHPKELGYFPGITFRAGGYED
jgi:hypothetical protein